MKPRFLLALIPVAVLAACGRTEAPATGDAAPNATAGMTDASPATNDTTATGAALPSAAVAQLESKSGTSARGMLEFRGTDGGVSVTGEITGLTQGSEHGFHVHQVGDCSAPDASSAGPHWNPTNAKHGSPSADAAARHLGDMPNILADEDGHATVTGALAGATLRDGGANDVVGKAVVVHARRDDYVTQPSGDSGDRIACGVIR